MSPATNGAKWALSLVRLEMIRLFVSLIALIGF